MKHRWQAGNLEMCFHVGKPEFYRPCEAHSPVRFLRARDPLPWALPPRHRPRTRPEGSPVCSLVSVQSTHTQPFLLV